MKEKLRLGDMNHETFHHQSLSRRVVTTVFLPLLFFLPPAVHAADTSWTNTGSGFWTNSAG